MRRRIKQMVYLVWFLVFRVSYKRALSRGGNLPFYSARIGPFRIKSPSLVQLKAADRELSNKKIEHYAKLFSLITRGRNTVVDFGANLGYSTLAFFSAIQKISGREVDCARFVLIEPNPDSLILLRQNIAPVHEAAILPLAIGDYNGFLWFGVPSDYARRGKDGVKNSGLFSSVGADFIAGSARYLPVVDFDAASKWIGPADDIFFAKLDLEGGELAALTQAESWFDSDVVFQVELNPRYLDDENLSQFSEMVRVRRYKILSSVPLRLSKLTTVADVFLVPENLSAELCSELNMTEVVEN